MALPLVREIGSHDRQEIHDAVARLVEELGILQAASPGVPVVIKPNLFTPAPFHTGCTTDPRIVEGLCLRLQAAGLTPVIAEGSGARHSGDYIFQVTGFRRLADSLGVRLVDLNEDDWEPLTLTGTGLEVGYARTLLDAPVIIDVPKVKTHIQAGVTLSMKNLMGGLSKPGRIAFHFSDLHQNIPALSKTLMERGHRLFCLADGIISMEGNGPMTGDPKRTGFLLGAPDPLTADLGLCHMMGLPPHSIPHVREACALFGLAESDLEAVRDWAAGQRTFRFRGAKSFKSNRFFSKYGTWVAHRPLLDLLMYGIGLKPMVTRLRGRAVAALATRKCSGCQKCLQVCPARCFSRQDGTAALDAANCLGCGICVEACPEGALSMIRI